MALDSTAFIMLAMIFVMGFVFSLLGITDFVYGLEKKKAPYLGLIGCFIAAVVWFPFTLIWFANSDLTPFFGYGYLWLALGFIFVVLGIGCAGLILRNSVKPEEKDGLEIRERVM